MLLKLISFRDIRFVRNELNWVSSFTYLQKLQIHVGSSHVLIRRLKISRFLAVSICSGRLFHKIPPSYLTLFRPNIVWYTLGVYSGHKKIQRSSL